MVFPDVNILVNGFREDTSGHEACHRWLDRFANGDEPFALPDSVLASFLRIVTHRQIFKPPAPLNAALAFAQELRARPNCVRLSPGPRHWEVFTRLCREGDARGNLIADAYLAALAIESGCELVTLDRDFARFPGLRWRPPVLSPQP